MPDAPSVWLSARRLLRLSQVAVAEFVGTSRQAVGQLEAGKRRPKVDELLKYASLYRVRPEALLANVDLYAGLPGTEETPK